MDTLIECHSLVKTFSRKKVIDQVNLKVEPGKTLGLVGPNGAGKTTLFSMISGYLKPSSGTIKVLGHDPSSSSAKGVIGTLPQDAPFIQGASVYAQLSLFAKLQGFSGQKLKTEVSRVLEQVKIADLAKQYPETLSFGQRKRVAIAQALLGNPALVLLDEPTSGLDPIAANDVRNIVRELRDQTTFIISSHNLDEIGDVCNEVIIIKQGKLVRHCPIAELVQSESSLTVVLNADLPEQAFIELQQIEAIHEVNTDPLNTRKVIISFSSDNPDQLQLEIMSCIQKHNVSITEFSRGEGLTDKVVDLVKD